MKTSLPALNAVASIFISRIQSRFYEKSALKQSDVLKSSSGHNSTSNDLGTARLRPLSRSVDELASHAYQDAHTIGGTTKDSLEAVPNKRYGQLQMPLFREDDPIALVGNKTALHRAPSVENVQYISRIYSPLLDKSTLKLVEMLKRPSGLNGTSDNLLEVGTAILGQLSRSVRVLASHAYNDAHKIGGTSGGTYQAVSLASNVYKRHGQPQLSSFMEDQAAPSRFCIDHAPPDHTRLDGSGKNKKKKVFLAGPPQVAICLVGVPRTMTRPDVRDSFVFRFLGGLGASSRIFAVLSREDTVKVREVKAVLSGLKYVFIV